MSLRQLPAAPAETFSSNATWSTLDVLADAARRHGDASALLYLPDVSAAADPAADVAEHRTTYVELHARVLQAANLLTRLGITRDQPVAIVLPLLPQTCIALWGAEAAGIAMPMNYLLSVEHMAHMLRAVDCSALIALGPDEEFRIWDKALALRELVPSLRTLIQVGGEVTDARVLGFDAACDAEPADRLVGSRPGPDDTAAYFHTGGTTGAPKLARHTHRNQVHISQASAHVYGYRAGERLFCGMPMFHVAGSLLLALAGMSAGCETVLLTAAGLRNKDVVGNFWPLVERYRPAVTAGSPTSLVGLAARGTAALGRAPDTSSVRLWFVGGAPLPTSVADDFERTFDVPVREGYGMTESGGLIAATPVWTERRAGSAGPVLPGMEVRVVRPDLYPATIEACASGRSGLVLARGPNVFPGYVETTMNDGVLDADGWLVTGDLGHLDADGYLHLTGRAKDVIIRGSHNIDPVAIEEVASQHPDVLFCAAVGQPDRYAGEVPVLYVSAKPGRSIDTDALQAWVATRVAEQPARPKRVCQVDDIPLTAVGKVFKPELRLLAAQHAFDEALRPVQDEGLPVTVRAEQRANQGLVAVIEWTGQGVDAAGVRRISAAMAGFPATVVWPDGTSI